MTDMQKPPFKLQTSCVRAGTGKDATYLSVATPIYATSTFAFKGPRETTGHDYSRTTNPTREALEDALATLEGGAGASATATGMAATSTALHLLGEGAHVITGHDIYGGTYRLFAEVLNQRAFSFSFVRMANLQAVRDAIRPETRALWVETPSNPLLNLVDIAAMAEIAREHDLLLMVDNTFMTPVFQRPLELGADLVVHSTTKYLNGHSDIVGGAIVSKSAEHAERIAWLLNNLGTCSAPFDAWLVSRGIKTLPLRMEAHARNAQCLAEFLSGRSEVERVYYPGLPDHPHHALAQRQMSGFGGMLSFDMHGGEAAAFRFVQALQLFEFAESLGGVQSLIEHPDSMSHLSMTPEARTAAGIRPGNLRVSVGIEDPDDLIEDMARAFTAC